jgi:hypothetical protein
VQQVAGLSQLAGELMLVNPIVIDLGWGELKSALVNIPDSALISHQDAGPRRRTLVDKYVATFRRVEAAAHSDAKGLLKDLAVNISNWVVPDKQAALTALVDSQISKLS